MLIGWVADVMAWADRVHKDKGSTSITGMMASNSGTYESSSAGAL
jgi:hypothetical protein